MTAASFACSRALLNRRPKPEIVRIIFAEFEGWASDLGVPHY